MTDQTAQDALKAAREALRTAQEALRLAERAAGLQEPTSDAAPREARTWDEITVKRINLVEDDGRLRMIIGNATHGTVAPMRGRMRAHPGRNATAGLLFINDDGTECGGLQYSGRPGGQDDRGPVQSGYMTFDDFEQNESLRIGLAQRDGVSERFIEFTDQPAWSLVDFLDDYEAATDDAGRAQVRERYFAGQGGLGASRLLLTRDADGNARIILRDGQGRDRLRFTAPHDGDPTIEFVNVDGDATSLIPW